MSTTEAAFFVGFVLGMMVGVGLGYLMLRPSRWTEDD
jgi:ABC-type nitrate/sulfonate/bicarbonate transport system permease component